MLRPGLISESHQTMYFNVKSMTDDGRFMLVACHYNEYTGDGTGTKKTKSQRTKCFSGLAVIDFMKDDSITLNVARDKAFLESKLGTSGWCGKVNGDVRLCVRRWRARGLARRR